MNKQSSLPWIISGLSISAAAVAITLASVGKPPVPNFPQVAARAAPTELAAAVQVSSASQPELVASEPEPALPAPIPPSVAPVQTAAEPPAAGGQIWECTTNGIRTFSNNPCGDKSSLVEVRALNTMNATPFTRPAGAYGAAPVYPAPYSDPNAYQDQEAYGDQDSGYAANSYAVIRGIAFLPRRRIEHPHRPPPHHDSGPPPRRN